jgi:dipeptidyl aminopeptidase/acylaminoacyl peptidase
MPEESVMSRPIRYRIPVALLLVLLVAVSTSAQEKKVLTLDDYSRWSRVVDTALSPDGVWMSYGYRPNEGEGKLFLRNLDGGMVHEIARGTGVAFSPDSRWAAWFVDPPEQEGGRGRGARGGPPGQAARAGAGAGAARKLELMDLRSGEKWVQEHAGRFVFSEDGKYLAVKLDKSDPDAQHAGTDLALRDLARGIVQNIGNVNTFAFNKAGTLLAWTVDAANQAGNGVYLMDLGRGVLRTLDSAAMTYDGLSWDEEGKALVVLRGKKPEKMVQRANALLAWTDLGARGEKALVYDPAADPAFPEGNVLSEFSAPRWSKDRSMLFLGIKAQEAEPERSEETRANVDVWHWKDERVQSVQMRQASRDQRATLAAVLHLAGPRLLVLADEEMPSVTFNDEGLWAIGRLDAPYRGEISWGGGLADYYRVDVRNGERTLIAERLGRSMGISPDGKWYLYLQNEKIWAVELATLARTDLSALSGVDFVDRQDDHPYELPAYGIAGWSKDGRSVIISHRYDLWSLPLGRGQTRNLTAGVGDRDKIRFGIVRLDRTDRTVDTSKPILLSAYGDRTKKSGYWTLPAGREPQPLIWQDRSIGGLQKAEKADRVILTMQTFEEFPDWWATDLTFKDPVKITDANPQQAEYAWGRRILVDYTNSRGVELQATLALPAGYVQGRRYPMLVYFYELMSDQHHRYSMPTYDDRPHMSTYASNGYLVLQPDVVYEIGKPGSSALDCVGAAVRKVIELGYADPAHIGLQGHSWGGYQSSFLVTQTDMFACVVTGAPPTDLYSFYNTLYKSTGTVQQGITEVGQVRMGTTPFEDFELFLSQSPIHHTADITTPFLILHGTDDGSVDWIQGLEYYNMAKRQGKNVILLSYEGEAHHLGRKENQKDFQIRMKQYFDHYLMGKPAPAWMTEGVPFLKKETARPTDGLPPN